MSSLFASFVVGHCCKFVIALFSDYMNVRLFCTIDEDEDGQISRLELRALIIGIRFDEIELDKDDAVDKVMKDFDTNLSNTISPIEFIEGVSKWLREAKHAGDFTSNSGGDTMKFLSDFHAVRFSY